MIVKICFFTEKGKKKAEELFSGWENYTPQYKKDRETLTDWAADGFEKCLPLVFMGACGIAVRIITPFIKDKQLDSPVIVIDEEGKFVIPILSGHLGGANELAVAFAGKIGAIPVITTATDIQDKFSVDVFAKRNGLHIQNREGIRRISGKLLTGRKIGVSIDPTIEVSMNGFPEDLMLMPYPPKEAVDILITEDTAYAAKSNIWLTPKRLVLGIGCRKGKKFEELRSFVENNMDINPSQSLCAISSINLKKNETGLMILAQFYHVPFFTYSKEELGEAEGEFTESAFVKQTVGIANVCERSAMRCAKEFGKTVYLLHKKTAQDGMTMAVSVRAAGITTWETGLKQDI